MKINYVLIMRKLIEKKMSQQQLSKLTGISPQSISNILARKTCKPENAGRIAEALEIDPISIAVTDYPSADATATAQAGTT